MKTGKIFIMTLLLALPFALSSCSDDEDPVYLYLDVDEVDITSSGGTIIASVQSNSLYTASTTVSWITQSADGTDSFTVSQNTSTDDRQGGIVFTAADDVSVRDTLWVNQNAKEVYAFTGTAVYAEYEENTIAVAFRTNTTYEVSIEDDWAQQVSSSSREIRIDSLYFHLDANATGSQRYTLVTVTTEESNTTGFYIIQDAELLSFSSDTVTTSYKEKSIQIALRTNSSSYDVDVDEDWLQYLSSKSMSMNTDSLYFHVDENTSELRTATVTVTSSIGTQVEIIVKQNLTGLPDYEVIYHKEATVGDGIKIAFAGDGFTDDQDTYNSLMTQSIEAFFDIEPFRSYQDYFEVYGISAASETEGITTKSQDTAFGLYIPYPNYSTEIDCDENLIDDFINAHEELDDLVLFVIIANSSIYAGTTWMYTEGYNIAMTTACDEMDDVLRHEAGGHGFGFLADEYIYYNRTIPNSYLRELANWQQTYGFFLNLSTSEDIEDAAWYELSLLDKYSDTVGMYEGGYEYAMGIWRSEYISIMDDNRPYFNAISRQLIVERIMELSGGTFDFDEFVETDVADEVGTTSSAASRSAASSSSTLKHYPPQLKTKH